MQVKARPETGEACEVRFGQVGLACVRAFGTDAAALEQDLARRVEAAPALFARAAVVLDLSHLLELPDDATVIALIDAVRAAGMLPVGLAYGTSATAELAGRIGLPLIAKFRAAYEPASRAGKAPAAKAPEPAAEPAAAAPAPAAAPAAAETVALFHAGSVRSGQQLYARGRDLIVAGMVANGAEVIADGNIHVYGGLRGRAMAGAQGNAAARIFVADFRAELVAIAGQYRVFERIPEEYEGHSVQCWLEGDKLLLARL